MISEQFAFSPNIIAETNSDIPTKSEPSPVVVGHDHEESSASLTSTPSQEASWVTVTKKRPFRPQVQCTAKEVARKSRKIFIKS